MGSGPKDRFQSYIRIDVDQIELISPGVMVEMCFLIEAPHVRVS